MVTNQAKPKRAADTEIFLSPAVPDTALSASSPLHKWLDEFCYQARLSAKNSYIERSRAVLSKFFQYSEVVRASQITNLAVGRYLTHLYDEGSSLNTIGNYRSHLSRFGEFLKDAGALRINPCSGIRLRHPDEKLPRYLNKSELKKVLQLARQQGIQPQVALAVYTGLRLGELRRLQWADVDFNGRYLVVKKAKSKRPRAVPLSALATKALKQQRRKTAKYQYVFPARRTWPGGFEYIDKPAANSQWLRMLYPIKDAVPKFRELPGRSTGRGWHLFRHTFASRAAQAGVSLYKLAIWMGHSDVRTTKIYAHLQSGYDKDIELTPNPKARKQA